MIVVLVTCPAEKEARLIATILVTEKLAACANLMPPVQSFFHWKGKFTSSKEYLLIIKAPKKNFKKLEKRVKELHSYDTPEIIAMPVVAGSKEYMDWVKSSSA